MPTNNTNKSDLQRIHGIVQNTMIKYPKELLIHVLRDFFSQDSYYHYEKDEFGFTQIKDQTNLPLNAGMIDPENAQTQHLTTRIYIGEQYKSRDKLYPSIIVKGNSVKDVPYSATNEEGCVQYEKVVYIDQATNQKAIAHIPKCFILAGSWEGDLSIEVATKNSNTRDEIVELINMCYKLNMQEFINNGLIIKPLSIGSPSETQERNDFIFKQSITAPFKGEWRIEKPIYNLIERIVVTVDYGYIDGNNPTFSPEARSAIDLNLSDEILKNIYPNSI